MHIAAPSQAKDKFKGLAKSLQNQNYEFKFFSRF